MGTHIVNISLDDEAYSIWTRFPRGERSRYLREVIKDADAVRCKDLHIQALKSQVYEARLEAHQTRMTLAGNLLPDNRERFEERLAILVLEFRELRRLESELGGEEE